MNKWIEIRHVMTRDLVTARVNETLTEIKAKLDDRNIQHIPIMEGKKIMGMISKGDLLRMEHHLTVFNTKKAIESNKIIFDTMLAGDVMTRKLVMLRENDPLTVAVDLFRENLFHALPVINDQHDLVGIVTPL
ncbi:MAG TPA: CBS domain-containing protein, partial [Saprospiraceae bacterium]|nr:CBS domain-containing protein [Saprospiraceae bacterium]